MYEYPQQILHKQLCTYVGLCVKLIHVHTLWVDNIIFCTLYLLQALRCMFLCSVGVGECLDITDIFLTNSVLCTSMCKIYVYSYM